MKKVFFIFSMVFLAVQVNAQEAADTYCCRQVNPMTVVMELSTALQKVATTTVLDLSMQSPKITAVPEEIGQLIQLQCLDISYNRVNSIPESFKKLENLTCLNLSGNHYLQSLPIFLNDLPNLKVILLKDLKWTPAKMQETKNKFPNITILF